MIVFLYMVCTCVHSASSVCLCSVTCSAILALLEKDDDLRARHELLNTERIL